MGGILNWILSAFVLALVAFAIWQHFRIRRLERERSLNLAAAERLAVINAEKELKDASPEERARRAAAALDDIIRAIGDARPGSAIGSGPESGGG